MTAATSKSSTTSGTYYSGSSSTAARTTTTRSSSSTALTTESGTTRFASTYLTTTNTAKTQATPNLSLESSNKVRNKDGRPLYGWFLVLILASALLGLSIVTLVHATIQTEKLENEFELIDHGDAWGGVWALFVLSMASSCLGILVSVAVPVGIRKQPAVCLLVVILGLVPVIVCVVCFESLEPKRTAARVKDSMRFYVPDQPEKHGGIERMFVRNPHPFKSQSPSVRHLRKATTNAWDKLQLEHDCCGLQSFQDWIYPLQQTLQAMANGHAVIDDQSQAKMTRDVFPVRVPLSCCKEHFEPQVLTHCAALPHKYLPQDDVGGCWKGKMEVRIAKSVEKTKHLHYGQLAIYVRIFSTKNPHLLTFFVFFFKPGIDVDRNRYICDVEKVGCIFEVLHKTTVYSRL